MELSELDIVKLLILVRNRRTEVQKRIDYSEAMHQMRDMWDADYIDWANGMIDRLEEGHKKCLKK